MKEIGREVGMQVVCWRNVLFYSFLEMFDRGEQLFEVVVVVIYLYIPPFPCLSVCLPACLSTLLLHQVSIPTFI